MRFDWFQVSIATRADLVLEWAKAAYSECEQTEGKGLNGYESRLDLVSDGVRQLSVSYGGRNLIPNLLASGPSAPRFAELARKEFTSPGMIRVTRMDACEDFDEPGAFDTLHEAMKQVAFQRGVATQLIGDWERAERGRTYIVGAKDSAFRAVSYEKGLQLKSELEALGTPRPHWTRLEGRFKPHGADAKMKAASLSPEEVWGVARWAPALLQATLDRHVQRLQLSEYRVPDLTMALHHMGTQFRRSLCMLMEQVGGDLAAFGAEIWSHVPNRRTH